MQVQTSMHSEWKSSAENTDQRDLATAVKRGIRCRCPNCGEGRLFRKFLKPVAVAH